MKRLLILLLGIALAASVFAGGQKGEGPAKAKEVRMWTFLNPAGENPTGRNLALKKIIENFEDQNPNVKITVEPQQWDIMTSKFLAAHQAGTAPDIQWVISYELGTAIKLGALQDFESMFLNEWSNDEVADIDDSFFQWGITDGKHYQVTHSRNYFCPIIRQDLFDEYGLSSDIKSWSALISAAKKFNGTDANTGIQRWGMGQAFGTGKVDPPLFIYAMLDRQDSLFTPDGKANWANRVGAESLQGMVDMITKHKITPETAVSYDQEEVFQDFTAGKYGMISGAAVRVPTLRREAKAFDPLSIQLILWPSWSGNDYARGLFSGWAVGVWSKSKVMAEAADFLQFMMNEESDKLWVLDVGQVPVRKSTITALGSFFADPENAYLAKMAEGFAKYCWVTPTDVTISGWREDLNKAAQDVVVNGTDPLEALKKVAKDFDDRNM